MEEETQSVTISKGIVKVRKPNAGQRNHALMKAETPDGLKVSVFLVALLPSMIAEHPFGVEDLNKALDSLSCEDYDKIFDAAKNLINVPIGDIQKKSVEP